MFLSKSQENMIYFCLLASPDMLFYAKCFAFVLQ